MHPHTFASSTSSFTPPLEASSFAPGQTLASTFPSPLSSSFVPALASPFPPPLQSSSILPSAPSPASFLPPPPASFPPPSSSSAPSFPPLSSSSTPSFPPPLASSVPPSSSSLPLPRQTVSPSGRSISSASTGTGTGTGKRKSDGGGVSDRASKRTNTNKDSTSQNLILLNSVQGSLGTIVDSLRQVGFTPEANIDTAIRMVQSSDLSADDQSVLVSLFSDQPNKAAAFRALDPGEVRDLWIKRELEKYRSL